MTHEEMNQGSWAVELNKGDFVRYIEGDWAGDIMLFDTKEDAQEYIDGTEVDGIPVDMDEGAYGRMIAL